MTRKRRRLYIVLAALLSLGAGAGLILSALKDNIVFFRSPSEVAQGLVAPGQRFRLGGLVEEGSVEPRGGDAGVRFSITDGPQRVAVVYEGLLPDLFREGQGVVAEGALDEQGVFRALNVLAKHDENYMPPEVAEALKKSGQWRGDEPGGGQGAP